MSAMRLFLTGNPGVGKTTLIRAVLQRLEGISCAGFYTVEKRLRGERVGFSIVTFDGQEGTLASLGSAPPTIGKYSIRVDEFEKIALPRFDPLTTAADLYVIDEIGKMELLSSKFRTQLLALLARRTHILASVAKKGNGLVTQIKSRSDIELIEVTRANRDQLSQKLATRIMQAGLANRL
jgi:nucleoside-triphosphatase